MQSIGGFPGGSTVLMAVFRGDEVTLFDRAVRSVFCNSLCPEDFVLVVDGPVSSILDDAIGRLTDEFSIRVLRLTENRGLAAALNAGLAEVSTEWVIRADADDFNVPERLKRLAEVARGSNPPDLVGSAVVEVGRDGQAIAIRCTPLVHQEIVVYARYRNPFNHMTVAYRSRLARICGGYPQIHLKEDYALWASMIGAGAKTQNLPDPLVHATAGVDMYRRRGGLRYALAEINLQRHLVRCGLKGTTSAALHGLLRASVFLMPAVLRGWIYEKYLRVSHPSEVVAKQ